MGKVQPEELIFTQLIKKFPAFMEPEFNSSSLEPVTGTCRWSEVGKFLTAYFY